MLFCFVCVNHALRLVYFIFNKTEKTYQLSDVKK